VARQTGEGRGLRRHIRELIREDFESLSLPIRNCFAVFVRIAVVVFSHPIRIRDLSILFDDARIFGVSLPEHAHRVAKVNDSSVFKIGRVVHTNDLSGRKTVAAQSWRSKLSR
jgi:hypothetical protein